MSLLRSSDAALSDLSMNITLLRSEARMLQH